MLDMQKTVSGTGLRVHGGSAGEAAWFSLRFGGERVLLGVDATIGAGFSVEPVGRGGPYIDGDVLLF
jgi:hypothetical protein